MNPEVNLFGLYAPALLLCAPLAWLLTRGLRLALGALGLDRFVWHPGLFHVAAFVCLLGLTLHSLTEATP